MSATSPTSTLQMCHDLVRFNRLFPQCCPDCYSSKWNCCEESDAAWADCSTKPMSKMTEMTWKVSKRPLLFSLLFLSRS